MASTMRNLGLRQLEVRYVTTERRLLGWIQVPVDLYQLGKKITIYGALEKKHDKPTELEIVGLQSAFGSTYLALKADGFTPEKLRNLLDRYEFTAVR